MSSSFTNTSTLLHAQIKRKPRSNSTPTSTCKFSSLSSKQSPASTDQQNAITNRRKLISSFLGTSMGLLGLQGTPLALAQNWGTHSWLSERFFGPRLSPEDAVARIKQTAEGLHAMREMLDRLAWRYVIFYIRLKQGYLEQDLKNAMTTLPEARRKEYVRTANELVDNWAEFDRYVRTPKVYESYLYYEKTLKSLDDLVAMLA